jgi:hypothetical protein
VARSNLTKLVQDPELEAYKGKLAESRATEAARRAEAAQAAGAEEMAPRQSKLLGAREEEAWARLEKAEAVKENRAAMMAKFESATGAADEAILKGRKIGLSMFPEGHPVTVTETVKTMSGGGRPRLGVPSIVARPDFGVTAQALVDNPELGSIYRRWLGPEFVPEFVEGGKRGSFSMKNRSDRLRWLIEERGEEWAEKAGEGLVKDTAAFMLSNPAFTRDLDEAALMAIGQAAAGKVTQEGAETTIRVLETKLSGRTVTPRLREAQETLEDATIERLRATAEKLEGQVGLDPESTAAQLALKQAAIDRMKANAELQGARTKVLPKLQEAQKGLAGARAKRTEAGAGLLTAKEQTVAPARRALEEQMARTGQARAAFSALDPRSPYANFGATWLNTGRLTPAGIGMTAGAAVGGLPGGIVGGTIGALASGPAKRATKSMMASIGRVLMKADGQTLQRIADKVPLPLKGMTEAAYQQAAAGDPRFRVTVGAIMASPAFRDWIESGEADSTFPEVGFDPSPEERASELSRRISVSPVDLADEILASDAPDSIKEKAAMALKAREQGGPKSYTAAVSILLSSPAFRSFASGATPQDQAAAF